MHGDCDADGYTPSDAPQADHLLLLAQRQLFSGYQQEAMRTALRLREYESVLQPEEIYSLVALTAFYSRHAGPSSPVLQASWPSLSHPPPKQRLC